MSRLSIKTRITIWYTGFLLIMVGAVLAFLFTAGSYQTRTAAQSALAAAVAGQAEELEYEHGALDTEDIKYYVGGAYLSLYDGTGVQLGGRTPGGFPALTPLQASGPRTVSQDGESWYIYDLKARVERFGDVWVRGVMPAGAAQSAVSSMLRLALIALPALVLLAGIGGWYITRQAFWPVKRIADTAERIGGGRDLSQRIGLPAGGDEIHALANTFDRMFARLEAAFQQEKRFTDDASHELRTPAAVIIAQSEYALAHPGQERPALETVLGQARKMSGMLSQLLTLARADSGRAAMHLETLNLSELTELVAQQQREAAAAAGIALHDQVEPDVLIRGDETMLMRMWINLIENALRFTPPGGSVWVGLAREGERIRCTVRDEGVGMTPEALSHIWERFYQADPARSGGGAGLGLPMVQWIVRAHGGSVQVRSAPGEGSEFTVLLPQGISEEKS